MTAYRRNCRRVVWYNGPRTDKIEHLAILLPWSFMIAVAYLFSMYFTF